MDKQTLSKLDDVRTVVGSASADLRQLALRVPFATDRERCTTLAEAMDGAAKNVREVTRDVRNEVMAPNAIIWSTSTEEHAPKKYFLLIKEEDGTQIPLEIHWHADERKVTADVYLPQDYNYTLHDGCDHENDDCILDDPDFQEELHRDEALFALGYKEPQPHAE